MRRVGRKTGGGYHGTPKAPPSIGATTSQPQATTAGQASALPIDATYNNTVGANNQTLSDALLQIGYQRGQLNTGYGFQPIFDAAGNITGENFDASNPFSKAALLQKSYTQNKASYGQNLAGRGQLYSSSYQNAQDYAGTQYGQGYDTLKRSYEQGQQGLTAQAAAARNAAASGNANAYGAWVDRGLATKPPGIDPGETPLAAAPARARAPRVTRVKGQRVKVGVKVGGRGYVQ